MEKKRVKVEVVNGEWEIKKYKMRQSIKAFKEKAGPAMVEGSKYLLFGAGIGAVIVLNERIGW